MERALVFKNNKAFPPVLYLFDGATQKIITKKLI